MESESRQQGDSHEEYYLLHRQRHICYLCYEKINGFKISSQHLNSNESGKYFCIKCLFILEKKYKQLNNETDDDDYEKTVLTIEYKINFRLPKPDIQILSDIVSNRVRDLNEKLIEETDSEGETKANKKVKIPKLRNAVRVENNQTVKLNEQTPKQKHPRSKKSEKFQSKARTRIKYDALICRVCMVSFSNKDERSCHERTEHRDSKTKLYQCPNCDFSSKIPYLARHCRKQVCINRQIKTKTVDKAVNCRLCKLPFLTHELRSQHEIDVHLNQALNLYYCSECNYSNKDSNSVMQHRRRIHEKGAFTKCRICDERGFATQQLRNIHEVDAHLDHSTSCYSCTKCNINFVDKNEYICHLREHSGATISICPICGKNFGSENNMSCHMDTHKMTKDFQCDVCGKTFTTKYRVQIHLKTHSSDKKYQCDQCDKSYKGHTDLRRHKYTHGLIEPRHMCNVCEKKFFEPKFLRAHMKLHEM